MSSQEDKSHHRLIRSTAAVSLPTLISRVFGYLRDMLQAFYMGTGMGNDAFTMAFVIPNLLRRLTGEGAMTAAFIPVFTEVKKGENREDIWKFANAFFYDLMLIMTLITGLGILLAPSLVRIILPRFADVPGKIELTITLTKVMFPYIFLVSLAALAGAILNSLHKFFLPAFTPVLFNLSIITAAALFAPKTSQPAYVFAGGVLIGGICQLAVQVPLLWRKGMRFTFGLSFRHPAVRRVGRLIIPGIFGVGIYQINFTISRWLAHLLESGSVSYLYYSSRIEELTLGLFSIALSIALLPTLSELAVQRNYEAMKKTLNFSMRLIALITLPAMAGLLVLNRPVIQILFQRGAFDVRSTAMTSSCLFFFAFGIPVISGVKILAPAFYSLKDTKTPVYVAFFVMLLNIVLSVILMNPLRAGGIALAMSLASTFNFIALFVLLERKIGKIDKSSVLKTCMKSGAAAAVMAMALRELFNRIDYTELGLFSQALVLLAAVAGGIGIYLGINLLINREDLRGLRKILARSPSPEPGDL